MSVCIVGTTNLDSIETPFGKRDRVLGGSGVFAATASSIFSETSLVSVVGEDFPSSHMGFLRDRGIRVEGIEILPGKTFHWTGRYEDDMAQAFTISTELNVLADFQPKVPESSRNADVVFLANIDPVLQLLALKQFHSPKLVVLDSMNYWISSAPDALLKVIKEVDVLIINDQEVRDLTGKTNLVAAIHEIMKLGPSRVIVKKGEHGLMMFNGKTFFMFPAVPLSTLVDPTGAGDSFAGAISGYLAKSMDFSEAGFRQAVIAGTLVASFTVQAFSLDALKEINLEKLSEQFELLKGCVAIPTPLFFSI